MHGVPNKYYLMVANETIGGDSNFNIECIRKVLCDIEDEHGGSLPPVPLCIQADNAGDNKNQHVLFHLFVLAWVVHHDLVGEVEISMLLVGESWCANLLGE